MGSENHFPPKRLSSRKELSGKWFSDPQISREMVLAPAVEPLRYKFLVTHVGTQHFRNLYRAVLLLVIFHDRYQGSTHCQA